MKKTNNQAKISLLCLTGFLLVLLIPFLSSCSLPNDISNYMNAINNNGNEEQILNEKSNYSNLDKYSINTNRINYPNLNDQEFANFKSVDALGLKKNLIYRSASPIDNSAERATYADALLKINSIKNIINLENTKSEAESLFGYDNTYYSKQNILFSPIDDDLNSEKSMQSVNKIINFINNADGPILIHCKDGASKTGIICAILQSLNVAGYDYLKVEYIKAYMNLYNTNDNITEILNAKFRNVLSKTLGLTSHNVIYTNLNKYTKLYFEKCGIDKSIIEKVKQKLSSND